MKKRHEQKLVFISIVLLVLLNVPLIFVFNTEGSFYGFPTLYFSIFIIWIFAVIISFFVLKKYHE